MTGNSLKWFLACLSPRFAFKKESQPHVKGQVLKGTDVSDSQECGAGLAQQGLWGPQPHVGKAPSISAHGSRRWVWGRRASETC